MDRLGHNPIHIKVNTTQPVFQIQLVDVGDGVDDARVGCRRFGRNFPGIVLHLEMPDATMAVLRVGCLASEMGWTGTRYHIHPLREGIPPTFGRPRLTTRRITLPRSINKQARR